MGGSIVIAKHEREGNGLKALRIALVVSAYVPAVEYGGPINKVRALAWGLQELGHKPEVWCADYGPGRGRLGARRAYIDDVPVRYLRRIFSYRWSPFAPQAALLAVRSAVDVGHCFGMWDGLALFAAMGFRHAGVPYVVEPLGMYPPLLRNVRRKRIFASILARGYLGDASAIIATSDQEAERLSAQGQFPVRKRLNPLIMETPMVANGAFRRQRGIPEDVKLLGWVGRISRSKGLDILVEALAMLPGVHLALAGPDDRDGASMALHRTIENQNVGDRVHLAGALWGRDRDEFLANIDAFVLPSVTENFGNAAVEAAVMGLPLVVSDRVGAGPWLQELGAADIAPLEASSLAQAIQHVLTNTRSEESRMATAAAVRRLLSPRRIAADQVEIYRSVSAGS